MRFKPGSVAQLVKVMRRTADPGVASSILGQSHTFMEIDHETISSGVLLLLIQKGLVLFTSEIICAQSTG